MNATFLLIDLFLLFIPVALLLLPKLFSVQHFKSILFPALLSSIVFSAIASLFTFLEVWNFNDLYVLGYYYKAIPLEHYLFAFAFSFAGLGIYSFLNLKFPNNHWQKYSLSMSNLLLGICIALLFFAYSKWYTVIAFAVLFFMIFYIEYINELRFMYRFYRAYLVVLIPFYISYGLLCNLPVVAYKFTETVGLSILNIPLENHFYMMAMLLCVVYIFEVFTAKIVK